MVLHRLEKISLLNRELRRSNGELDSFAHAASHDLKEPLRGIHNYAVILSYDTKLRHVVLEYTRILQDGLEQPVGHDTDYMLYQIEGDVLRKYIGEDEFPEQVHEEPYRRSRDHNGRD